MPFSSVIERRCGLCDGPLPCLTHSQGLPSSSAGIESEAIQNVGNAAPISDVRWAINVLLEKIAAKFEANETMDIWRSDAAATVRGFKHDLSGDAAQPSAGTEEVEKILRSHFYTGEPGQYEAIKAAAKILYATPQPVDAAQPSSRDAIARLIGCAKIDAQCAWEGAYTSISKAECLRLADVILAISSTDRQNIVASEPSPENMDPKPEPLA